MPTPVYTVVILDAARSLSLIASKPNCTNGSASVLSFLQSADKLATLISLDKIEVRMPSANNYTYDLFCVGGTPKWHENIRSQGNTFWTTFLISGEWNEACFVTHRLVRDSVRLLITNYGITSLDYKRL